jgi:RNA polymerase sigma-70 factor (ECF subfamily)
MANDSRTGSVLFDLLRDPGRPHAWEAFVDRYGPRIHGWCRRSGLQEADAENVTQEVLVKLLHKLPGFTYDPDKGTFRGWLKTVTLHALDDYRDSQRRAGVGAGDSAVLRRLDDEEARADLLRSLAEAFDLELWEEAQSRVRLRVSARDWKIFQEVAVDGRPVQGVAREHGLSATAARMAKFRVEKKLREEVARLERAQANPPKGPP